MDVVEALITASASVNTQTKVSVHAMDRTQRNRTFFYMFIESGCILTQQNMTPLMYAAMTGHGPIVELLLSNGADPNLRDNVSHTIRVCCCKLTQVGRTAYDLARGNGNRQICQQLRNS